MALTAREKLVKMTHGAKLTGRTHYTIEYSLDIRGNLTIWGGMEYPEEDAMLFTDDPNQVLTRKLLPLYEHHTETPYTARIYQMEQALDENLTDEAIIEAYREFRRDHPDDGFGFRLTEKCVLILHCSRIDPEYTDEEKRLLSLRRDRDDKQEVLDRLLKAERQDILNLWGVDCPPDCCVGENAERLLGEDKSSVSGWFRQEFERIGGDYRRLYPR